MGYKYKRNTMKKNLIKLQLLILMFPSLMFGLGILKVNTNSVLQKKTRTLTFAVLNNPEIDTVLPYSVSQGDTVIFTITSHSTQYTQGINDVKISNLNNDYYHYANSITVVNDTTLLSTFIFYYTLSTGIYDLCIESVAEGEMWMNDAINVLAGAYPPSITITPDSASQGQTVHVTVTGTNTFFTNYHSVMIRDNYHIMLPYSYSIVNDTLITADFTFDYNDPAGVYDVEVYGDDIYAFYLIPDGFTINAGPHAPILSSISPSSALQGDAVTLHITGNNTHFTSGVSSIKIGPYSSSFYTVINDSTIDVYFAFTYNMAISNNYSLKVTNSSDGTLTLTNAFALLQGPNPPSLKKIVPTYTQRGDTITISLIGINTTFNQVTNTFSLQNIYGHTILPTNVNCIDDTLMEAEFYFTDSDSLGKYDVRVPSTSLTPTLLLSQAFTLFSEGACIMSIFPDTATVGTNITITVNALDAHYLAGINDVLLQSIYGFTPLIGTNITVINDSTLTADFNFTTSEINGKYGLIVTNAIDGTIKIDTAFTLYTSPDGPHIIEFSPNQATFSCTISASILATGTQFLQDIDSLKLCNSHINIYPLSINIVNDTVIDADFLIPPESYPYFNNMTSLDLAVFGNLSLAFPNAIIITWPINVTEVHEPIQISVYPNPAKDRLTIKSPQKSTLEIINLQGQSILQEQLQQVKTDIDISGLAKGVYFLRLNNDKTNTVIKIIKE
jgi:hypothetical protein